MASLPLSTWQVYISFSVIQAMLKVFAYQPRIDCMRQLDCAWNHLIFWRSDLSGLPCKGTNTKRLS